MGITAASLSVDGYYRGVPVDERGYFSFHLPYCPGEIVIRARANGYVSTLRVVDIPYDTLGTVDNVQVVLFKLADPVSVVVGEENIVETSGAARIIIPAGTTFLDGKGNEARDNVNAILNFIDPSKDNFDDSPGRFVTDRGEDLMSFGVMNLRFANDVGDSLTPRGDIRIALASDEPGYILWILNSKGKWVAKISRPVFSADQAVGGLSSRNKRQTGITDLGGFGNEDIGQWINIDKVPDDVKKCYVKTRVFDDISFTSEVVDNGVDQYQPKFVLKIGNAPPFQGLILYRPPTYSPGETCYEVRCGTRLTIQGFVSVMIQETLGNGQSIPLPAIPVQLGHAALPSSLDTKLGTLNYQVNPAETEAKLNFVSSPDGPLYEDMTICERSALTDYALWFARRKPVFTDADFGRDVCYARLIIFHRGSGGTYVLLDQLLATSVWGNGPYYFGDYIAHNSEFVNTPQSDFACMRYRCSETADLTSVYLDTFSTYQNVTCYASNFTPPVYDPASPVSGYYGGIDDGTVRGDCMMESDPMKTAGYVKCYFRQGNPDGGDDNSKIPAL